MVNKIMVNKKILIVLVFGLVFVSCSKTKIPKDVERALLLAEENKSELLKVINKYNKDPSDSLKLKSAYYLIANMPYHSFLKVNKIFDEAFLLASKERNRQLIVNPKEKNPKDFTNAKLGMLLDSISQSNQGIDTSPVLHYDLISINADFLIDNIELAFEAWYRLPENKRASFDDFCNYILPYRCSNEPLVVNSRQKLYETYSWVYEDIEKGIILDTIVDRVKSKFNFNTISDFSKYCSFSLDVSQIESLRIGRCDDGVNYYVNVFRALGIVAARDFVEHWGNNPSSNGHSWIYTKLGKEEYQTDVHRKSNIKGIYRSESIPKVYRNSYEIRLKESKNFLTKDVTDGYVLSVDASIDNLFKIKAKEVSLNVFDKNQTWYPVDYGAQKKGKFHFKNIGYNVLYLPMDKKREQPFNYPFFINKKRETHVFKPNNQILDSVIITRKIGLSSRRYRSKLQWMRNLNGGVFEVANNPEFKNAKLLYKISNFKSTHVQRIKVANNKQYKYVRFRSNKPKSFLAKLAFYDANMKPLKGEVYEENILKENETFGYGAFDESGLTYDGGDYFELGYHFNKPKIISYIEFQARNDDNHINIDENYELFYWDKYWKSLGKQRAKDTLLIYDNVPKNALLWLRNLTKGKEEHVFIVDEDKRQKWLGFENK